MVGAPEADTSASASDGPDVSLDSAIDLHTEYTRLGVGIDGSKWRLEEALNMEYLLCPTYPHILVVPGDASADHISAVARYRSRGRLPVLCWRMPSESVDDGSGSGGRATGTLIRSAQPGQGLLARTSTQDEEWIRLMWFASQAKRMVLIDSRSVWAAYANRFRGGGVENPGRCTSQGELRRVRRMARSLNRLREYARLAAQVWSSTHPLLLSAQRPLRQARG